MRAARTLGAEDAPPSPETVDRETGKYWEHGKVGAGCWIKVSLRLFSLARCYQRSERFRGGLRADFFAA